MSGQQTEGGPLSSRNKKKKDKKKNKKDKQLEKELFEMEKKHQQVLRKQVAEEMKEHQDNQMNMSVTSLAFENSLIKDVNMSAMPDVTNMSYLDKFQNSFQD